MMHVRVWQSYSCNNSSSFRLVARFTDARTAKDSADELTKLFKAHAKQGDDALEELYANDREWPPPPTKACQDLAKKYGFTWEDWLHWGDDQLGGDEPIAVTHDETLVLYHGYCNGFPSEISDYLKARGAKVEREAYEGPDVSVLFRIPNAKTPKGKKLEASLSKVFAQAASTKYLNDWKLKPPWSGKEQLDGYSERVAFFSDGTTIGFYLPIGPKQIDTLKKWLAREGVQNASIRLCEPSDCTKFKVIAGARCDACQTPLSYIDPRTHEIDSEQLACSRCGGMFDLADVTKKYEKAEKAAAKVAAAAAKAKAKPKKASKSTAKIAKKKVAKKVAKKRK